MGGGGGGRPHPHPHPQPIANKCCCGGCLRVQVAAHVLNLQLQLALSALGGALERNAPHNTSQQPPVPSPLETQKAKPTPKTPNPTAYHTLKFMCSRKCAVPLFLSVSYRLPLLMYTPTVAVSPWPPCHTHTQSATSKTACQESPASHKTPAVRHLSSATEPRVRDMRHGQANKRAKHQIQQEHRCIQEGAKGL